MCDLLTGVVRRGTAAAIPGLGFTRPSAGKTGTSNDYADAWYIGFTPQIICCVWVGVDERRSMGTGMTGAQAAVPIFARAMMALHKKLPIENFERPDSVVSEKVCAVSHKPAQPSCPQTFDDWFILGKLPAPCDVHGPGKTKKSNMMKLFGPQEKQETKMPAKKRLTF
jgi:penicillin-binding protein 1A